MPTPIKFSPQFPACAVAPGTVLALLMPIKRVADVIYGARYAKRLLDWGIEVKIHLLHVTQAGTSPVSAPEHDTPAAALLREAALYLSRSQLDYRTFIFSGDVVFSILDAAELLNCQEIVLPAVKTGAWPRLFSGDIAGRITRSKRGATVVLAEPDGMRRPALAA